MVVQLNDRKGQHDMCMNAGSRLCTRHCRPEHCQSHGHGAQRRYDVPLWPEPPKGMPSPFSTPAPSSRVLKHAFLCVAVRALLGSKFVQSLFSGLGAHTACYTCLIACLIGA